MNGMTPDQDTAVRRLRATNHDAAKRTLFRRHTLEELTKAFTVLTLTFSDDPSWLTEVAVWNDAAEKLNWSLNFATEIVPVIFFIERGYDGGMQLTMFFSAPEQAVEFRLRYGEGE